MIITETKALQIVANEEIAGRIPAFSSIHQSYVMTKRSVAARTGCGKCDLSEPEFAALKERAWNFIRHLPQEGIESLKNHLVTRSLVFYDVSGGVRQKTER